MGLSVAMGFPPGVGPGAGGQTFESLMQSYVSSGALPIWIRKRETTGSTTVNYGSLGTSYNGTIVAIGALGQTGVLGDNEAFTFDGNASAIDIPASANHSGLTQITKMCLCKPTGLGEADAGYFINHIGGGFENFFIGGAAAISVRLRNTDSTFFTTTTTTGVTLDSWQLIVATYNNTGDRKIHIWKGDVHGLSELGYSAQPALTDTFLVSSVTMHIGNVFGRSRGFAGMIDETMIFNTVLSQSELEKIHSLIPFA